MTHSRAEVARVLWALCAPLHTPGTPLWRSWWLWPAVQRFNSTTSEPGARWRSSSL